MVLTNSEEYRAEGPDSYAKGECSFRSCWSMIHTRRVPAGRFVGMIMVPWRYIVRAEVEMADEVQ